MKQNLYLTKDLLQYLEKAVQINPSDLKLNEFERGHKAGQMELVAKLRGLLEQQERSKTHA